MDFYDVLKVPPKATQAELDRAYQKLVRDARYDNSINQKDLETAYHTLSDATKRALYDATLAEKGKRLQTSQRIKRLELNQVSKDKWIRWTFAILLIVLVVYYPLRFGYRLKKFNAGDQLYFKDTGQYFGKVEKSESNHHFATVSSDAYLVDTAVAGDIWFPADDVKSLCRTK